MSLIDNIVYYYKFDESSGNASDSVSSNTLTNTNTVGYGTGIINNGADGGATNTSKYFTSSTMAVNLSTGACTINFWMKPTASKNTQMVFLMDGNLEFRVGTRTSDLMWFTRYNGVSAQYREISVNYDDGSWRMVTATFDGSTVKAYINGTQSGTDLSVTGSGSPGAGSIKVGGYPAFGDEYFTRLIDEVGIWERALSATEITELYNSGAGIQYPFTATTNTTNFFAMMM